MQSSKDERKVLSVPRSRKFFGAELSKKSILHSTSSRGHVRKNTTDHDKKFRSLGHMNNAQKARSLDNSFGTVTETTTPVSPQDQVDNITEDDARSNHAGESWLFHPGHDTTDISDNPATTFVIPKPKRPLFGRTLMMSTTRARPSALDNTENTSALHNPSPSFDTNPLSPEGDTELTSPDFDLLPDTPRKPNMKAGEGPSQPSVGGSDSGEVKHNAEQHKNQSNQLVRMPNGRVWFKGDMLVELFVGQEFVGSARVLHVPWEYCEPIVRLKKGHTLPLHFQPTPLTRTEYDRLSREQWFSYIAVGSIEAFDDSQRGFDDLARRLETENVATIWTHPTDNVMLLLYSIRCPDWRGLGRKTIRNGESRLHLAFRQKFDLTVSDGGVAAAATSGVYLSHTSSSDTRCSLSKERLVHTDTPAVRLSMPQRHVVGTQEREKSTVTLNLKTLDLPRTTGDGSAVPVTQTMDMSLADAQIAQSKAPTSDNAALSDDDSTKRAQPMNTPANRLLLRDVLKHASAYKSCEASKSDVRLFVIYLAFPKENSKDIVHMRQALIHLGVPTDRIWLHEESSDSWRRLRDALQSRLCLVLFERYFKVYNLRNLAKALDRDNLLCWRFASSTIESAQRSTLERIFPYGTALTFSESCFKYKIEEVVYILKWFQHRAMTQLVVPHQLLLPPLTSRLLEDRAEQATEADERAGYLKALSIILELTAATAHTTRDMMVHVAEDGRSVSSFVHELDLQGAEDLMEPSSQDALAMVKYEEARDGLVLKHFSGWAYHNIHRFRRFLGFTVGTKPVKCEHVRFHLTDHFVRQRRKEEREKAARKR